MAFQKGAKFTGDVYLFNTETKQKRDGGDYAVGTMTDKDGQIPFKSWNVPSVREGAYNVVGVFDEYKGTRSAIIKQFKAIEGKRSDFTYTPYGDELKRQLNEFVSGFDDTESKLFQILVMGNGTAEAPNLFNQFKSEQAAVSHHDAYYMGLSAHSLKVGKLAKQFINDQLYSFHKLPLQDREIMVVCAFLHDLGKTVEYNEGQTSEIGQLVSHRTIMNERLTLLRNEIIPIVGETGYWTMHSIFAQHHGQYEETPRTIEAFFVHLVDSTEARLTDLSTGIAEQGEDQRFHYEGFKLHTPKIVE